MNNHRHRDPEAVITAEQRAARDIDCPACAAVAGQWCPMPGTTWYLHPERIAASAAGSATAPMSPPFAVGDAVEWWSGPIFDDRWHAGRVTSVDPPRDGSSFWGVCIDTAPGHHFGCDISCNQPGARGAFVRKR